MYRSLSRAHIRSVADAFTRSKAHEKSSFTGQSFFRLKGESIIRSVQAQVVDALRCGERERASNLLSNVSTGSDSLRSDDFLYILDYCARSPDPLFVMETWRIMEEKEVAISRRCYFRIIRALCKGGYVEEAFNWLNFLGGKHQTYPILPMYNSLLNGCAQMQSMMHASRCLDLMEERMMGKSEVTYYELLKLAVYQGNLSAVHEIWKEWAKYYSPSIISLRKFIWSFAKLNDLVSAFDTLQQMVALVFKGTASIKQSAEGKFHFSRLDIPVPLNNALEIRRCNIEESGDYLACSLSRDCSARIEEPDGRNDYINVSGIKTEALFGVDKNLNRAVEADKDSSCLQLFPGANQGSNPGFGIENSEPCTDGFIMLKGDTEIKPLMKVLRWSFNDVIHACAQSKNAELAEQVFIQMNNLGLKPSRHTYHSYIKVVVSERGITDGMKVLKEMTKRTLKPYNATLATLSMGCSKNLELDLAEALVDQIVGSAYLQPFNALLAGCDVMDQPERAVWVLAKMKQLKLQPDIRTYELLFSLFGNVNAPYEKGNMLSKVDAAKRIKAIELDMMKNEVQHSLLSMQNLLKALGAEGMIRELIQYLHVAENQFCLTNTYARTAIYNTVLHSLVEANESLMAIEVFKNMKYCGLPPDAVTYNIMIDCCSIIRCFKSASALVSMMLRAGFYPRTCTYTALIKILLVDGDFDEALNLLDQASLERIPPDVLSFNTFLQEARSKGRIDIIEHIVERMHQEKIQPDPSTCSYVFSAYVARGFLSTATEALQVLSMRMISEDENTLQEKRAYFEDDFILAEGLDAESRILELFKDDENLAAALLNIRWCALVGFPVSWLPNESVWAKRLSSYRLRRAC
ncbi:pentatricopeptide repeat-containing protein At1g76280 isoform X2 [Macadamia integrifolia]|uniref:pentatricopeptide repeat-containing protein At1g76280 isoform X2 n=1 Tax=Macadamia integrifolia TaxID=60698 RepID=UPI001C52B6EA|nr:pentatricopeptide repeat-containing protein At1g76280 isoform X2 [Macadamia integrifolia]